MNSLSQSHPSTVGRLRFILPWMLRGASIAGVYGAMHDQLTYSISPEYFTRYKFHQFDYLDFAWPSRVYVGLVGFQAAWPVGALIGWIVASYCYVHSQAPRAPRCVARRFVTVFGAVLAGLFLGGVYGYVRTYVCHVETFLGWEHELHGEVLRRFIVAACIHNSAYLAAIVGLAVLATGGALSSDGA